MQEEVEALLDRYGVPGVSLYCDGPIAAGLAREEERMTPDTWVQYASLSKTIGTAFAFETFREKGIDPDTSVNKVLRDLESTFVLEGPYAEDVKLYHLCQHTALGMHYVPGLKETPEPLKLLQGSYASLCVEKEPGSKFHYSGGGFIVLEHVLNLLSPDKTVEDFLRGQIGSGLALSEISSADGHYDDNKPVPCRGGFAFPAFAAGLRGSPRVLMSFLRELARAYHGESDKISRETARAMLEDNLVDLGSIDFMGAYAGLGTFVAYGGPNKFMLHQAANDGFRGMYLVCFDGPDKGKGFVIVANGDTPAVFLNSALAVLCLKKLNIQGVDLSIVQNKEDSFDLSHIPQEQIVNLVYKHLVFDAFTGTTPAVL